MHSVEEVLEELKKYDSEDVYVIGGEQIYRQMLPYCDTAHMTKIDHAYEADAYFQIWMRRKNGKSRRRAMSRRILIWNIIL